MNKEQAHNTGIFSKKLSDTIHTLCSTATLFSTVSFQPIHKFMHPPLTVSYPNNHALILTPVSGSPGFAANEGQTESDELAKAGFQSDIFRGEAVSPQTFNSMPGYSLVYIEAHGSLTTDNDGNIATGVSSTDNLPAQGVKQVTIPGDYRLYQAIDSTYISINITKLPRNAIVFLNSCNLGRATKLISTLESKGAETVFAWDGEEIASDAAKRESEEVMTNLVNGQTADEAVANSADKSIESYDGTKTVYAYLTVYGKKDLTLADARDGIVQIPYAKTNQHKQRSTTSPISSLGLALSH